MGGKEGKESPADLETVGRGKARTLTRSFVIFACSSWNNLRRIFFATMKKITSDRLCRDENFDILF